MVSFTCSRAKLGRYIIQRDLWDKIEWQKFSRNEVLENLQPHSWQRASELRIKNAIRDLKSCFQSNGAKKMRKFVTYGTKYWPDLAYRVHDKLIKYRPRRYIILKLRPSAKNSNNNVNLGSNCNPLKLNLVERQKYAFCISDSSEWVCPCYFQESEGQPKWPHVFHN